MLATLWRHIAGDIIYISPDPGGIFAPNQQEWSYEGYFSSEMQIRRIVIE